MWKYQSFFYFWLSTIWSWSVAKVLQVDSSLVQIFFSFDSNTEWIYRSSTCLEPLFRALIWNKHFFHHKCIINYLLSYTIWLCSLQRQRASPQQRQRASPQQRQRASPQQRQRASPQLTWRAGRRSGTACQPTACYRVSIQTDNQEGVCFAIII